MSENNNKLKELRDSIDEIDAGIINLLKQRLHTVSEIGAYKKQHNIPLTDEAREEEILAKAAAVLGPEAGEEIFKAIINSSKALESKQENKSE